jgi:hypothetical protein
LLRTYRAKWANIFKQQFLINNQGAFQFQSFGVGTPGAAHITTLQVINQPVTSAIL